MLRLGLVLVALMFASLAHALSFSWKPFEWLPVEEVDGWRISGGGELIPVSNTEGRGYMDVECRVERPGWYASKGEKSISIAVDLDGLEIDYGRVGKNNQSKLIEADSIGDLGIHARLEFGGIPNVVRIEKAEGIATVNGTDVNAAFKRTGGDAKTLRAVFALVMGPKRPFVALKESDYGAGEELTASQRIRFKAVSASRRKRYETYERNHAVGSAAFRSIFAGEVVRLRALGVDVEFSAPTAKVRMALDRCIQMQFDYWKEQAILRQANGKKEG